MDDPALPELTTEVAWKPNWRAAATAVADDRSFTVPVGFDPSYLARRRLTPRARARSRAVEQRRLALAEGHPVRRIGDGQHGGVAPEPRPARTPGPSLRRASSSYTSSRSPRQPAHSRR